MPNTLTDYSGSTKTPGRLTARSRSLSLLILKVRRGLLSFLWFYSCCRSIQDTVKEYSEHTIKAIFELSTLENPYIVSLFGLIYEFLFFLFFFELSAQLGGQLAICRELWVVMYAPDPILALNRSTRLLDQTTITKVATLSQNQGDRPTYFIVKTH